MALRPLDLLRRYLRFAMGKGTPTETGRSAIQSIGVVRRVPGRGEPLRVWHYTATVSAVAIERDCALYPGRWGTDGPGVYVTDIAPSRDRAAISDAIWEQWRPQSMEAFIGLPFIDGEMEPSTKHRHVWVVKRSELRITGLEDLEIGFWQGSDPSDPHDRGDWIRRPLRGCP